MFQSIYTCFKIQLENSREIFLSSFNEKLNISSQEYLPNSGLKIVEEETNLSGVHEVIIHGIYEKNGITVQDPLLNSQWFILWCYGQVVFRAERFFLKEFTLKDLEFILVLETKIANYKKNSLLKTISKTCRAKFGDEKCTLNIEKFAVSAFIKNIKDSSVIEVSKTHSIDGYFNGGTAIIFYQGLSYRFFIEAQKKNFITLDVTNSAAILNQDLQYSQIKLLPTCNKSFAECRDKYKNALNFRGEPFIPKSKITIN